jgi:hypothetical protein
LRLVDQSFGQLDAPPQSARKPLGKLVGAVAQAKLIEQLVLARAQLAAGEAVQSSLNADVFGHGQFAVETGRLEHHSNRAADGVGLASQIAAQDRRRAVLQRDQRGEQAKQRSLPPPLGPRIRTARRGRSPATDRPALAASRMRKPPR